MIAKDFKTGEVVGRVDVLGGGAVIPERPIFPVNSLGDLKKIPIIKSNKLLDTEPFVILNQAVSKAHEHDRFFVASPPPEFTMDYLSERRGREQALLDLIDNPDLCRMIMDIGLEISIEYAKALVQCGIDALYIGDPSASSSLISPIHFEEFCLPRYKSFCDELHKNDVLIYLHICGNSVPILEMMADTEVDCIEPLDPLGGVNVADAKRRVGQRVALMGGVNTLTLLKGTPESVYDEAISCCKMGGQDGGYILAAGDMVPDFSPEPNVRAMIQAAKDFSYVTYNK